jgi:hypothetical protein
VPSAIEIIFDDRSSVAVPVDDVRWLAGELRRTSNGDPTEPAVSAAVILERAVEDPAGEPNATFTPSESAEACEVLRRSDVALSDALRILRDGLLNELDQTA